MTTVERMRFPGAAGDIETLIESPSVAPIAVAICCHPHPLFGGSMTNKVIHTVAKTFLAAGSVVIRFNFRGVGASAGVHDEGRGETDDVVALARWARERWPGLPLWLGGNVETARLRHIQSSPLNWVTPDAAPTLIVHGTEDKYVAYEQGVWMRDRLQACGVEVELLTLEGAGHGFKGADAEKAEQALLAFFEKRLGTPNR